MALRKYRVGLLSAILVGLIPLGWAVTAEKEGANVAVSARKVKTEVAESAVKERVSVAVSAGEDGGDKHILRQKEKGVYRVKRPAGTRTWMLPSPGDGHNACDRGDVTAVHWSPNGKTLVAEVVGKERTSLCLYDLRYASFDEGQAQEGQKVQVMRLSILPASEKGSWGAVRAGGEKPGELDPSFRVGGAHATEVALVHTEAARGARLFGVSLANGIPDAEKPQVRPLDGLAEGGRGGMVLQPRFFPGLQGPLAGALVMVTDMQGAAEAAETRSGCGKGALGLAVRRTPEQLEVPLEVLTHPCEAMRKGGAIPSDRYPAWNPALDAGQVAFVRVQAGLGGVLCLQTLGNKEASCELSLKGREQHARMMPAFSSDGRFLASWVYFYPGGAREKVLYQLEVLALGAGGVPEGKAVVALDAVQDNPLQPPALVKDGQGRWQVVVVGEGRDVLDGNVVARGLEGEAQTKRFGTDLRNLRGVAAGVRDAVPFLAFVAQGYRPDRVEAADLDRDKIFIRRGLE